MPAARRLFPERPEVIFESRAEFEVAAASAVLGDAGNLDLSYKLADALAAAVEDLGLGGATDQPRPFSRVWIMDAGGERREGVVLRCEYDEVAVFCPPTGGPFRPSTPKMRLSYRGALDSVEFYLHINDAVRLPEALVFHLSRPGGSGGIGRDKLRVNVSLMGGVRALGDVDPLEWTEWQHCEVLDLSATGMRIQSDLPFADNQPVELTLVLNDGCDAPFEATAKIRWNRADGSGQRHQGLILSELDPQASARYMAFVSELLAREVPSESAARDDAGESVVASNGDLPPALVAKAKDLAAQHERSGAGSASPTVEFALEDLERWMKLINAPRKIRPSAEVLATEIARCIERLEMSSEPA